MLRHACFTLVFLVGTVANADQTGLQHGEAARLSQAPTLDGNVAEDPAWKEVAPLTDFTQLKPDNGAPASERTEVYFGFTEHALHVGVVCHESDPTAITISNDGSQSDSFSMVLDTFGTGLAGTVFGTNPVGAEYDGQIAGEFADWNWSTLWDVRARTHDTGWSAEFAIPFQSLRYGKGDVQAWRVNFGRVIQRNNEVSYWSPVPRQFSMYRLSLAGRIDEIRVPPQRQNIEVTPYVLGRVNEVDGAGGLRQGRDIGLDVKSSITPSLTLDLTWNTDFAQVESDRQQVNLGRFSLFYPETRPFFLENAGAFEVGETGVTELFHSRRIGIAPDGQRLPIEGGARLSGKVGAVTNVGMLHMRAKGAGTAHDNDFTVVRLSRDLKNRSSVGLVATDRRGDGGNGQTYGVDGNVGIGEHTQIKAFAARTVTPMIRHDDHAYALYGGYSSPRWQLSGRYGEVGAGFNPELGFVRWRGYRSVSLFAGRTLVRKDTLREWRPFVSYDGHWGFDGYHETGNLHLESWWVWKSGADVWPAVNISREGVRRPFTVAGATVAAGEYDTRDFELGISSATSGTWSGGAHLVTGGFYSGTRHAVSPYLNFHPDEALSAWFSWDHNTIDLASGGGSFGLNLARAGLSYSFTPKINLRAVIQYNDAEDVFATNVRFSWLHSANAGFYLVYTEIDAHAGLADTGRELVVKYSHIFDVL